MPAEREKIELKDINIERITDKHKAIIKTFQSYEKELVDFLVEDALDNQNNKISVTYLWFYKKTSELVGYITVLTDAINLQGDLKRFFREKGIYYKSLPALKIGRLCVTDSFLRRGIGPLMIHFAIHISERIGSNAGVRFITTDAKRNSDSSKDSIHFYKPLGFEILKERVKGTTPMFKDLIQK